MVMNLLEWSLKVVIASFFLLLLSLLLWFVWNTVMKVFHGPELSFIDVAFLAFLAAIAVGSWGFSFLQTRVVTTP
jgi:hypothetical protein